ncbi:hypothetical protein [Actinophytocola sp. NPDC049390]|uniref:hypothetical protein n=1 Tax=Actinophytocola sp. NPDC049390 TaxID=3363894 RepID=UPI0037B21DD6
MARFHHTIALTPAPRAWFESAVAICWDALTEHLGSAALPPIDGDPLAAGAHYENGETVVTLDAWDRHGESAARVTTTTPDVTTTCHVRLHSAAAPRALQIEGGAGDGGKLTTGTGTVDFERWWTGGGTAVLGRFDHRMARGTVEVSRAAGDGWRVEVTVTVRGRGLYRPLAAPVLAVARRWIQREFVKGLDEFAARWDEEVPTYVSMSPDEWRARLDAELVPRTRPRLRASPG